MQSIKTILIYLILLLNINSVFSQTINDIYISGNFYSTPLIDIISEIEEANPVHFNYIFQQVEGIKVTVQFNQKSIPEALELILQNTGLDFSIRGDKNIVLHKVSKKRSSDTGDQRINKSKKYTVSGYIKDKASGESLIGAHILNINSKKGVTSNYYGFYSITLPADSINLKFSYVGYQSQFLNLYLIKDTVINIYLNNIALDEITITPESEDEIQRITQMSTIKVPQNKIRSLPTFLGEVDLMKVMQLFPGIQSGIEGSGHIYVRGGGPEQNLILLDGVPVYKTSNMLGLVPFFNANIIKRIQLIKGGFPARYGGRLSSVFDISFREGNFNEFHGEISIDIIMSQMTLEGPLFKNQSNDKPAKTSFILSGRRTYIDLLAKRYLNSLFEDAHFDYKVYDFFFKLNHKISNRDKISFSSYLSNEGAYYAENNNNISGNQLVDYNHNAILSLGNFINSLKWNHIVTNKIFCTTSIFFTQYKNDINIVHEKITTGTDIHTDYNEHDFLSSITNWGIKTDFLYQPVPDHTCRFGFGGKYQIFDPTSSNSISTEIDPIGDPFLVNSFEGSNKTYTYVYDAYFEDDMNVSKRFKINFGMHASGYNVKDIFYFSLQPRISSRYMLNEKLSLKFSYVYMTQYLHYLTNFGFGIPTELWVPTTENLKPEKSRQMVLGIAQTFPKGYEISFEVYNKNMANLVAYREGANFLTLDRDWQNQVVAGAGRSYGAELFLQKKFGSLSGWIGYTLSWTDRLFEDLNFGERFPYKYDRRHDISITVMKNWNDKIEFSANWIYGTGNAIMIPISTYYSEYWGSIKIYDGRNNYRMNAYHRLDLNLIFRKEKNGNNREWALGIYNAYSRRNPFFIDYNPSENKFIQYSLFPIIPSISYKFRF